MAQQGDVLLFQTDNGGDIVVENGLVEMSGGLETSAYLSMFGGNEDDDGSDGSPYTYWGNLDENEESFQYRSETQNLLQSIPATSANLRRIEAAAGRDLAWFVTDKVASSVAAEASIPTLNRVKITVNIEANGVESSFTFVENWKAAT